MPTRNVNLTDHQSAMIDDLIAKGRYQNASEVVRDSMRLLERREQEYQAKLQALLDAAQVGLDAYNKGDFVVMETEEDIDQMFDEIEAELAQKRQGKAAA